MYICHGINTINEITPEIISGQYDLMVSQFFLSSIPKEMNQVANTNKPGSHLTRTEHPAKIPITISQYFF